MSIGDSQFLKEQFLFRMKIFRPIAIEGREEHIQKQERTRKTSIKCCHPAIDCSLRTRCQDSTNNNIANFTRVQFSLIQQCLQMGFIVMKAEPVEHNANKVLQDTLLAKRASIKNLKVPNLKNRCQKVFGVCIFETPSFGLTDCSSVSTI